MFGLFLFEGVEGSGKTTAARYWTEVLRDYYENDDEVEVDYLHFPQDNPDIVEDEVTQAERIDSGRFERIMFYMRDFRATMRDYVDDMLEGRYKDPNTQYILILDRSFISTMVYQLDWEFQFDYHDTVVDLGFWALLDLLQRHDLST